MSVWPGGHPQVEQRQGVREDALGPLKTCGAGAVRRAASYTCSQPDVERSASLVSNESVGMAGGKHAALPSLEASPTKQPPASFKARPTTSNPTLDSLILGGGSRGLLAAKRRQKPQPRDAQQISILQFPDSADAHEHVNANSRAKDAVSGTVWWLHSDSPGDALNAGCGKAPRREARRPGTSNPNRDIKDALRTWADAEDFCSPGGRGERRRIDQSACNEHDAAWWLSCEDDAAASRNARPGTANPTRDMEDAMRKWIDPKQPSLKELKQSTRNRKEDLKYDVWSEHSPSTGTALRPGTSNPTRDMEDAHRTMSSEGQSHARVKCPLTEGNRNPTALPRSLVWKLHPFTDGMSSTAGSLSKPRSSVTASATDSEMSTLNLMSEAVGGGAAQQALDSFQTVLSAAGVAGSPRSVLLEDVDVDDESLSNSTRMSRRVMAPAALDIDMISTLDRPGTSNPGRDHDDAKTALPKTAAQSTDDAPSSTVWNLTSPSRPMDPPSAEKPWQQVERPTTANPGRDMSDAMRSWAEGVLTPDFSSAGTSEQVSPQPTSLASARGRCDVWRRNELPSDTPHLCT